MRRGGISQWGHGILHWDSAGCALINVPALAYSPLVDLMLTSPVIRAFATDGCHQRSQRHSMPILRGTHEHDPD